MDTLQLFHRIRFDIILFISKDNSERQSKVEQVFMDVKLVLLKFFALKVFVYLSGLLCWVSFWLLP